MQPSALPALPPCSPVPVISAALPLPGSTRTGLPPLPVSLPGDMALSVSWAPPSVADPAAPSGAAPAQPNIAPKRAAPSAAATTPSAPAAPAGSLIALFAAGHRYRSDISNEVYHADRSCVFSSGLKVILRSPAHFQDCLNRPRKQTPALFFGTAIHARLLEPERFAAEFVTAPRLDKRSKEWKAFEEANACKQILTAEQTEILDGLAARVARHNSASTLIRGGLKEHTIVWQDDESGVWLKIRPDCFSLDLETGICLDLKSTEDASDIAFARDCVNYDYDLQAAVYSEGLRIAFGREFEFVFLALEKSSPYGVKLYGAPPAMLARGRRRMREALARLRPIFYSSKITTPVWQ
jgi:hypothetical protein